MSKKLKNLQRSEFIGLKLKASNKEGTIINETKHTFEILDKKGIRRKVLKNQELIMFRNGKIIKLNGKSLEIKPEERVKKTKW
jgi:RNase P/RNase MRP subunit p29